MKAYSGMPSDEFIALLRDAAIKSNATPVVIDQIDLLGSVQDLEADLEKTGGELTDMEESRDDLREELADLLTALGDSDFDHPSRGPLRVAYQAACSALERHGARISEIDAIRKPLGLPPCS